MSILSLVYRVYATCRNKVQTTSTCIGHCRLWSVRAVPASSVPAHRINTAVSTPRVHMSTRHGPHQDAACALPWPSPQLTTSSQHARQHGKQSHQPRHQLTTLPPYQSRGREHTTQRGIAGRALGPHHMACKLTAQSHSSGFPLREGTLPERIQPDPSTRKFLASLARDGIRSPGRILAWESKVQQKSRKRSCVTISPITPAGWTDARQARLRYNLRETDGSFAMGGGLLKRQATGTSKHAAGGRECTGDAHGASLGPDAGLADPSPSVVKPVKAACEPPWHGLGRKFGELPTMKFFV